QCGFCTPGIAVALTALWLRQPEPTEAEAKTALQGNLCRCTGYAPILRAAVRAGAFGRPEEDPLVTGAREVAARLVAMADGARVEVSRDGERAVLPSDLDDLLALRASVPEATLVAGATDVGLWATKRLDPIAPALFIGHLDELARIEDRADGLRIGALASYADMVPVVTRRWRWALGYWMRIGGEQVRAMGTIGGNIANGSPIGDTPPLLMALGAELVLASSKGRRRMPLEDFFLDYGRQDLRSGEIVEAVEVPDPGPQDICAAHKVSKRRDEDISALAMGLRLTVDGGEVASARIAFGGMAATPRRARAAEAALTGRTLDGHAIEAACSALEQDLTPISDCRASAAYRMTAAKGLLRRVWLEQGGAPVTLGAEEPA
ncbi:MAG: FAD binding domain-containing protein, partial [Pseudomonadota bacterium]